MLRIRPRHAAIAFALTGPALIGLPGCSAVQAVLSTQNLTVPANVQQGAADIVTGSGIIQTVLSYLQGAGVAVPASVATAAAQVAQAAAQVKADPATATGALAAQVASAGGDVITVLAPVAEQASGKWAPLVAAGLGALKVLLPVVATELNAPVAVAAAAPSAAVAALPPVTLGAARSGTWME